MIKIAVYYKGKVDELNAFFLSPKLSRKEYIEICHKLDASFLGRLAVLCGIDCNPELAKYIGDKAWEYGYSNGYREVAYYYDDLAEIVKINNSKKKKIKYLTLQKRPAILYK